MATEAGIGAEQDDEIADAENLRNLEIQRQIQNVVAVLQQDQEFGGELYADLNNKLTAHGQSAASTLRLAKALRCALWRKRFCICSWARYGPYEYVCLPRTNKDIFQLLSRCMSV